MMISSAYSAKRNIPRKEAAQTSPIIILRLKMVRMVLYMTHHCIHQATIENIGNLLFIAVFPSSTINSLIPGQNNCYSKTPLFIPFHAE